MKRAWIVAVGSLFAGSIAGAILFAPHVVQAQPTPSPSASSEPHEYQHGGFGGHELGSDLAIAAKAIGISEADLTTALDKGQTIAAVAKAHKVDPQKVIDALKADKLAELAAAVKAGTLTQSQADALKARVAQHAADQVNGRGGLCHGGHHRGSEAPGAT